MSVMKTSARTGHFAWRVDRQLLSDGVAGMITGAMR